MRTRCHATSKNCEYDSFEKVTLKEHGKPVHIKKRLNNSSICDHCYSQKYEMQKHLEFYPDFI